MEIIAFLGPLGIAVIVIAILVISGLKVIQEYERGVLFRLGKLAGARGPGLTYVIPGVERLVKIDLRVITMDVPAQEAITRDNVTVRVNAVVYFRVMNPQDAVVKVLDYIRATFMIAQTTLRSVLGQSLMDELLSQRDKINQELQRIIDEQTEPWGVKVSVVEVRDVELPQPMQRAMARQAEAEREKRAKIIHAEGEHEASTRLAAAAAVIAEQPIALQLRYLQTLTEIASERSSTVVFPLPIEMIGQFFQRIGGNGATPPAGGAPTAQTPLPMGETGGAE